MENRNDRLSSFLLRNPSPRTLDFLKFELNCSICLELFQDPVSIECGHNFCAQCITCHWDSGAPGSRPARCPECRRRCDRSKLVPDTRLRGLLENMNSLQQRANSDQTPCDVSNVEAKPLQLIQVNSAKDFTLDEDVLSQCLNHPQARNTQVCVISVTGEQRTGKSFLLNYLIQRLQGLKSKDPQWMKGGRAPQGFQCKPGAQSITKGLWIWSQPFILKEKGKEVAVFLVDTEGTISLETDKEMNAKLIALSMLLSSFQILNVSRMLKETDLDHLEMFLHIAEEIGKYFEMEPIQHLDLLVRDWFYPTTFGEEAGETHMNDVMQKISDKYPRIQKAFRSKQTRCYLLPFPGIKVACSGNANPEDMDPDFCEHLQAYITDVCSSAVQNVTRWSTGNFLTGRELAEKILKLSDLVKKKEFGFSSSLDSMTTELYNMRMIKDARKEFEDFITEQDSSTKNMFGAVKILPKNMWKRLSQKKDFVLFNLRMTLKGPGKTQLMNSFEEEIQKKAKDFQDSYKMHFCRQASALGGVVGAGILGFGIVGVGVATTAFTTEATALATGATVGATAFGGGVGAGIGAAVGRAIDEETVPEEEWD
ncbi:RING finger protein 112-like [Monodelphis domestica]|uniref:RING finger protein 112-like n=1 Tax=Monodelphis domestica TaxID=13616 RepID=UPI00044334C0|nr:RING finger protein 112-like [Monodelphis domestica]